MTTRYSYEGLTPEDEISYHKKRWQDYENDYILPTFDYAKEIGFNLHEAVRENPGTNCVEGLFKHMKERIETLQHQLDLEKEPQPYG